MNDGLEEPPRRYSPRSLLKLFNDPRRLQLALYLGAITIFGLFILAAAIPLSSNPGFCGHTCHRLNPEFRTWEKSSHAKVPCYACHANPSIINLLEDKLVVGPLHVFHTLTDKQAEPTNPRSSYSQKSVPSERCLRCHAEDKRTFTSRTGLNVTSKMHLKHLNIGLACTTCHNRVTHLGTENYEPNKTLRPGFKYKNFITMQEGCMRCHHAKEAYVATTGRRAPTKCTTCHNSDWRLRPESHDDVAVWRDQGLHGKTARRDMTYCQNCHASRAETGIKECFDCHGVTIPHPGDWRQIHFKVAAEIGKDRCAVCHAYDSKFSCNTCHHRQFGAPEPWVTAETGQSKHPGVARKEGVAKCLECHKPVFCPACHIRGVEEFAKYRQLYLLRER